MRKWVTPEKPEEYRAMAAENLGNLERMENMEIENINNHIVTILTQAIKENCPKKDNQGNTKLTQNTKDLIKQRRVVINKHSDDYRKLNKKISKEIRKDIRTNNTNKITQLIERNQGLKVFKKEASIGRALIHKLQNAEGQITSNRADILRVTENLYQQLYGNPDLETRIVPYQL